MTLYRYVGPEGQLREQGEKGPRHLNRCAWTEPPRGHWLHVGFRPLPQTTPFNKEALEGLINPKTEENVE